MSLKLDTEKPLFILRFQIELPSKVNWRELVPKLRKSQLHELEPCALELIHQTYIDVTDLKVNTILTFTASQFLQFFSVYSPFMKLKVRRTNSCYLVCSYRLKCNSKLSLKLDSKKGVFSLSYVRPPVNTHSSAEIVEMTKAGKLKPLENVPSKIIEDDRYQLELPSTVNWKELMPRLKDQQSGELEPGALDLIHQTYRNLIDLRDTIHVFTTSQFLQFCSIYVPFMPLKDVSKQSVHLLCRSQYKCKSTISITADGEKGLFYLRYVKPPVHGHSISEIVELAKKEYAKCIKFDSGQRSNVGSELNLDDRRSEMKDNNDTSETSISEYSNAYENPVKIEDEEEGEDDDNHVFSDQEGDDDANFQEPVSRNTTRPESKVKHEPSATIGNTEDDHNYDSDSGSEVTARIEVDDGDDDLS
ncbi:unnamed protein product [Ambrosiozyma monospora]|uniref:Unnamed protein product n=1 Tax=Ambrosiozyma monospora TaxID=43982 RepID=A0ACB5T232_AMBMO|nr:unnamed protein product [Ambrosiozyma monospora]